jgi:hypothetical protein
MWSGRSPARAGYPDTPQLALSAEDNSRKDRWHIDGFHNPGPHSPNNHPDEIYNFDPLVGICLSDGNTVNSGELCVYPGSHLKLARYFLKPSKLPAVLHDGCYPGGDKADLTTLWRTIPLPLHKRGRLPRKLPHRKTSPSASVDQISLTPTNTLSPICPTRLCTCVGLEAGSRH